eukprot:9489456-Pyramimonas_sp.AAC.1
MKQLLHEGEAVQLPVLLRTILADGDGELPAGAPLSVSVKGVHKFQYVCKQVIKQVSHAVGMKVLTTDVAVQFGFADAGEQHICEHPAPDISFDSFLSSFPDSGILFLQVCDP